MADVDKLSGVSKLAKVLTNRIHDESKRPLVLDFGTIKKNKSLVTNTFPVAIQKGAYSVCKPLLGSGNATLKAGMRVLVAWVQNEAVVIGTIQKSK